MTSPVQYLREVYQEMARVDWPKSRTVGVQTVVVICSMVVIIAIVAGVDSVLVTLISKYLLKG